MRRRDWARRVANLANLATPLGLAVAVGGRATLRRGPHGTIVAAGFRSRLIAPRAGAVTVGDVILLRLDDAELAERPTLLAHEARHCVQWACLGGLVGFPAAYGLASLWSLLRHGDPARGNLFERRAGLADGGYLPATVRPDPPACLAEPVPRRWPHLLGAAHRPGKPGRSLAGGAASPGSPGGSCRHTVVTANGENSGLPAGGPTAGSPRRARR